MADAARPPSPRLAQSVELLLYFIGAAGACAMVLSVSGWPAVAVAAALVVGLRIAADGRSRILRAFARTVLALLHLGWGYLALVFGWLLGWTVAWPIRLGLLFVTILALIGLRRRMYVRVPIILPLGIWICLCLFGWWREDGVIRCDDYARFLTGSSTTLAIPTTAALSSCAPGEVLRVARYPRRIWEAPDGSRFILTTQRGIKPYGPLVPDPIEDGVCEFGADGARRACFGGDRYKMQVILDGARHDRVFVGGWGFGHGILYAFSRSQPLHLMAETRTDSSTAEGYYDPTSDEIGLLSDEGIKLTRLRGADLSPLPSVPAPICPGETHYDPTHREGILCFSPGPLYLLMRGDTEMFLSKAFRSNPYTDWALGGSPSTMATFVWGCDFDPQRRIAWVAIANLGVIAVIDFDNGRVLDLWWAEPGVRSAVFDAKRQRLYVANFLRGDVLALDVTTGREVERWFAGRFVRYVTLGRDGQSLFATSNLGVVRIALP